MELDTRAFVVKIQFILNSQGNEKFTLFCQGTYDFQNLGNEISFIADYEYIRKSAFGSLAGKL